VPKSKQAVGVINTPFKNSKILPSVEEDENATVMHLEAIAVIKNTNEDEIASSGSGAGIQN
jgi:hypothetical protein